MGELKLSKVEVYQGLAPATFKFDPDVPPLTATPCDLQLTVTARIVGTSRSIYDLRSELNPDDPSVIVKLAIALGGSSSALLAEVEHLRAENAGFQAMVARLRSGRA